MGLNFRIFYSILPHNKTIREDLPQWIRTRKWTNKCATIRCLHHHLSSNIEKPSSYSCMWPMAHLETSPSVVCWLLFLHVVAQISCVLLVHNWWTEPNIHPLEWPNWSLHLLKGRDKWTTQSQPAMQRDNYYFHILGTMSRNKAALTPTTMQSGSILLFLPSKTSPTDSDRKQMHVSAQVRAISTQHQQEKRRCWRTNNSGERSWTNDHITSDHSWDAFCIYSTSVHICANQESTFSWCGKFQQA